jgi:hypothetical protein
MKKFFLVFALVLFLSGIPSAFAERARLLGDYAKYTKNHEYIFVMLTPQAGVHYPHDEGLRKQYKYSGLYKNDGSSVPLWAINGYAENFEVFISPDGASLAVINGVIGESASGVCESNVRKDPSFILQNEVAIAFFKAGKRVKEYTLEELWKKPSCGPGLVGMPWAGWVKYDDQSQLLVKTYDGFQYLFDVKTGNLLSKEQKKSFSIWLQKVIYSIF